MKPTQALPRRHFAFLTLAQYSFIALSSAVEALRMANRVVGQEVYRWSIVSMDGQSVAASNQLTLSPTVAIADVSVADIVFVCGGLNVEHYAGSDVLAVLRRLDRHGVALGSLCTGGYALAKAGLLDRVKAVVHWENMSTLREEFPQVLYSDQVFAIDQNRYTSSGGVAPLDMMLHIIKKDLGRDVVPRISDQFIVDRIRSDQDRQHIPLQTRVGLYHENLIEAAALMEANIEEPLSLDEVAQLVGVSRRQIERLFKRYVGQVPAKYYLDVRLQQARRLLLQSSMSVMEVAVACGFQSPPHFSKCYRGKFGHTPSAERNKGTSA
jgi:transcriptional regulator GlxA family with amidase domain